MKNWFQNITPALLARAATPRDAAPQSFTGSMSDAAAVRSPGALPPPSTGMFVPVKQRRDDPFDGARVIGGRRLGR
jgi:hypothetical protein